MSFPSQRRLVTIIYDRMIKADLSLVDKLLNHDFSNTFVGMKGGSGHVFECVQQKKNQALTEKADIGLQEAVTSDGFKKIDILFVPGGVGAMSMSTDYYDCRDDVRELVDAATWVVALSQGSFVIAATGRLDEKKAASHPAWTPSPFNKWRNVKWTDADKVVEDGKFITAYGWTEATVNRVLSVLATKFGFPVPTVSPVLPPSLDRLSLNEELQPWVDLMREMHLVSLRKVEKERAEGVDISQDILDAYPFIKAPATIQSITEKESLLGVELPQDYKAFLQVTNGTGFSGVDSIPNLLPIEELEWQDATECGLGELRVDVLPPTISSQSSSITLSSEEFFDAPILEKVLLISDLDEETLIFLLDPAYVWKVWTWVADRRNLPHGGGQTQWLLFSFVPWMPETNIWSSFEEYMRSRVPAT